MTVHDDIDDLLAADLHGELPDAERSELQTHLLDCATCRQAFQETKLMNQLLEEKLEKPDATFEQRVLANFRERVPEKNQNILQLIVDLMRLRSAQIAGVAAVLLALIQVGRMVTHENRPADAFMSRSEYGEQINLPPAGPMAGKKSDLSGFVKDSGAFIGGKDKKETDYGQTAPSGGFSTKSQAFRQEVASPPSPPTLAANRTQVEAEVAEQPTASEAMPLEAQTKGQAEAERVIVTASNIPTAEEVGPNPETTPNPALANRKLIRNATVELEIVSFDAAVQKITAFANEERGYVATTSSEKQENGKLQGEAVVKVVPENLDRFLQKIRGLGELKNQTLGTEDITKNYFDTDSRLKNSRVMEQRLIDMLKKKSDDINDLLQVEKELGRVREEIEKMQGDLKFWDSQVQFATVTISLAEKDMEEPAAFLLQEYAQLALFAADVEKTYNDIRNLASPKVQITDARLNRDNSGRVVAHLGMLIVPEESEAIIARVKETGRIDNFQDQTSRVAQGGNGLSENAKTKRDKVRLNVTITREIEEQPVQETSLRILTSAVDQNAARLKDEAAKAGAEVRNSTFARDPDGREVANISLRIAMKNYAALMKSLNQIGEVKDVSVQRHDKVDKNTPEENAPADLSIQIYSQGNIVASDTGIFATLRNTIGQSAGAIMWSVRMIGVAIAFLAPWVIALVAVIWIANRIVRARKR